jgi:hypothetical protein
MIENLKTKISSFFLVEEGGKKIINRKRISIITIYVFSIGLLSQLVPLIFSDNLPQGGIVKSDTPLVKDTDNQSPQQIAAGDSIGGISNYQPQSRKTRGASGPPIRYRAKQVFSPDASQTRIPSGANFIGKLLTSIDSRSPQQVHVILPYGGSHKSGGGALPPETILLGSFSYSGQGERIFMMFNRAVLPDGQELVISAQALSSKDYRGGVIGEYHSNKGTRMASAISLSMVSGISEVMVEKEGLGQSHLPTPKATLQNGLYNGLSKVTEMEAANQAAELGQLPSYVTIDSGSDVIISFAGGLYTHEQQQQ